MTSLAYGIDIPYEVQLEHDAATSTSVMVILGPQRSPDFPISRHRLNPGVYMVTLSYNGAAGATLHHVGAGPDNKAPVPAGTAGVPRTSAPMKISVQDGTEYLYVVAPSTGGSARATISVIPASTFDEMAESAKGVSVLSEISDLKTTKADKAEVADITTRLDTKANKVDVQNNLGDMVDLLAGWTADMRGGRNLSRDKDSTNNSVNQEIAKTGEIHPVGTPIYRVDKLTTAGAPIELGQRFAIAPGETFTSSVLVKDENVPGTITANMLLFNISGGSTVASSSSETLDGGWRRVYVTHTNKTDATLDRIASYLYANRNVGEITYFTAHKLERGNRATDWTPALEDAVAEIKSTGATQSANPLLPMDGSLELRRDTAVGTRISAGDTMIYGDTGWRALVSWDTKGSVTHGTIPDGIESIVGMVGGIWIRRTQERVTLAISGASATAGSATIDLPTGFFPRSAPYPIVLFRVSSGFGHANIGSGKVYTNWTAGDYIPSRLSSSYSATLTWNVFEVWPTTLPGLPA